MDGCRGIAFIAPQSVHVPNGRLVDPQGFTFWVSWQDHDDDPPPRDTIENATADDADAAVAWGRDRSSRVLIRLGHTPETYFSAGETTMNERTDGAGRDIPAWPATEPPEGWWTLADEAAASEEALKRVLDPSNQRRFLGLPVSPPDDPAGSGR